jgi:hypothetical protein
MMSRSKGRGPGTERGMRQATVGPGHGVEAEDARYSAAQGGVGGEEGGRTGGRLICLAASIGAG